jgi:hypothetical protein
MSPIIPPLFASIFVNGDGQDTRFWLILISSVAGAILLVAICWDIVGAWIKRVRGRTWPVVSAFVDIVSVAFMEDDSLIPAQKSSFDQPYYKATLTYVYRYPEEQMGDYSRNFMKKEDAEAWANSYKGETVKVHVDPSDPAHSILREEDL